MKVAGYIGLAVAAALVITGLLLFRTGALSSSPAINPDDPSQVAMGREIYAAHCAMCHGVNLEGQPDWMTRKPNGRLPAPPHDASGHTWHHPNRQLMLITKKGLSAVVPGYQSDMPAFEGILTDEQIAAVLSFIQTSWPQDIRERQRAMTRQAGS
jgi:mono/diheme cytochrome c family protein